ncbi:hypothetical protein KKG66_01500, partial [bacterium]|nr:hypothetical protein [bacterium]
TNTNIVYAGSASGGLWKSTDGTLSWFPLTDDLPSLAVGCVAIDPNNHNTLYIGTGEGSFNVDAVYGAGIFKSTDGGTTWNTTGMSWTQSQQRAVNEIVIDPNNSQILYAATNSSGNGVYKSTDGGANWTRYHFGDVKDIEMHPNPDSSNVLYCAVGQPWGSSQNGIYKSIDSGVTWTLLSNGMPSATSMGRIELDISPSNPDIIYAGVSQTISSGAGLYGIYRSTNGGASWTQQATSPNMYSGQGWYNLVIAVDPLNPNTVYSSGLDLYKSTDGGVNWTRKTYWSYPTTHSWYAHADHHALAFKPGNSNHILIGTDGGCFYSENAGDNWEDRNTGLVTFQFYGICNDALQPLVAFGGTQDNGTVKYSASPYWASVYGGDGGYCNVDPTNSLIVYCTTQRGYHRRSVNGGISFTTIMNGIGETGAWVTPRVFDPTNPNTLYTGTTKVYKTTNRGDLWTAISESLYSTYISTIAVAPSNPNVIYIGYEGGGRVFRTTNGGTTWNAVYSGLPSRYVTRVAVDPSNADIAWATVSGYSGGHVWKTTNGGSSWTNQSTGLPDIPVNDIVIDLNNPSIMYVGTDLGVYQSTNGGASWSDFSNGMPNVVVDDLDLHPTTGVLRAGTHGRGMWETSTGTPTVSMITPNGGENWLVGSVNTISWGTGSLGGNVKLELNRDYPSGAWETIIASTPNDGSYSWTTAGSATTHARFRVSLVSDPQVSDESNTDFIIATPSITLTGPVGGESWTIGSIQQIAWSLYGLSGTVQVYIDRGYPSGSWEYLGQTTLSYMNWTVTSPSTSTARVKVQLAANPSYNDISDNNFSIDGPWIQVDYPNGSESLTPGTTCIVRWSKFNLSGNVDVKINRAYPSGGWETLASGVSADSLVWTVDAGGTSAARIQVVSSSSGSVYDYSDANFTILTPTLRVDAPNGGESWLTGTVHNVTWTKLNLNGPVNLTVNRTYPTGNWELIAINQSGSEFSWTVDAPFSTTARIRVESVNIPGYTDISNSNFIIADGDPGIRVTAPNGSETWQTGTQQTVTWTRNLADGPATIQINRNYPSGAWETIGTNNSGTSFAWTVSGAASSNVRARVYLNSNPAITDVSDASFTITNPVLTLTYPNGGEQWQMNTVETITWTRTDAPDYVSVQLMRNYPGGNWETITSTNNLSAQSWTVSGASTDNARIRIYLTANPTVGDTSNANLSLVIPGITLLSPLGGEVWEAGTTETIRWSRAAAVGNVNILLNRGYPAGAWETLFENITADSVNWIVTGPATEDARIRLYLLSTPAIGDTSSADFTILNPDLTVTSPNGGEQWLLEQQHTVTFLRSNVEGPVTVQYMTGYPSGTWQNISTSVTGSSVNWTPSGSPDSDVRVRAFLNSDPAVGDTSNVDFALVVPALTVTAPDGGEEWIVGDPVNITWERFFAEGQVTVWLNRNYPTGEWETISSTESGSSMSWTITGPETDQARFKVSLNSDPAVSDVSNGSLTIIQPRLTLLSPNGGEEFTLRGPSVIHWQRTVASGAVTVKLNRNYPSGAWELITAATMGDSIIWNCQGALSEACRVRVYLSGNSAIADTSDENFTILERSIDITSHNGGVVYSNSESIVDLLRHNAPNDVTIELNRDYPDGSWEQLSSTSRESSFLWWVQGPTTGSARLRAIYNEYPFVGDTSDASFAIEEAGITLHSPDGGELWAVGSTHEISWTRYGFTNPVRVEVNRDYPTGNWELLAASVAGDSYNWIVSTPATANARVRLTSTANPSINTISAEDFTIAIPELTLTAPAPGEIVDIGFAYNIEWTRFLADGMVQVDLNRGYPSGAWESLGLTEENSLSWTPALPVSEDARIRVYLVANSATGDTLASDFTIFLPALTLTSPNGGEEIRQTTQHVVTWQRDRLNGGVRVELNTNYPGGPWTQLAGGITTNSYTWTVSQNPSTQCLVRVIYEANEQFGDSSDAVFKIFRPEFTVLSPAGGESFIIGEQYPIEFTKSEHDGPVKIMLNRNFPTGNWETLFTNVTGTSLLWTATGPETDRARIRVESEVYPGIYAVSADEFEILEPGLRLYHPAGGEVLAVGSQQWISWRRVLVGNVDVLFNSNYPSGEWTSLVNNGNVDSVLWTIPNINSTQCRIKVVEHGNPAVFDQSDWNFEIQQAAVSITKPVPGDTLAIGLPNPIRWTRNQAATGQVRIDLNRSYPGGAWETLGTGTGDELLWVATLPQTGSARLRAVYLPMASVGDTLDNDFAIDYANVALLTPAASGSLVVGDNLDLSWSRLNVGPGVDISINRDYPSGTWTTLASNVQTDNYTWPVAAPRAASVRLRILSVHNPALGDTTPALSILQPEVRLDAPNSCTFGTGNTTTISWTKTDFSGPVSLAVNYDYPGGAWENIATSQTGTSYLWTVGSVVTTHARLRVSSDDYSATDLSDSDLSFVQPVIEVTSLNEPQAFEMGQQLLITWTKYAAPGNVKVELNRNFPEGTWETLAQNLSGLSYSWILTGAEFAHGRFRVSMQDRPEINDITNANIGTYLPDLYILSPNGGDTLVVGQQTIIKWARNGSTGVARVKLNRDYPSGTWETLGSITSADSILWTPNDPVTEHARVKVELVFNQSVYDLSDEDFSVLHQELRMLTPQDDDSVAIGDTLHFSWARVGVPAGINVYLKRNYPSGQWEQLAGGVTNDSWNWIVSGTPAANARFRIVYQYDTALEDIVGPVVLGQPELQFTSPAAPAYFIAGDEASLAWNRSFASGEVLLELSRNGVNGPWEEIGTTTANSINWSVAAPATNALRFRATLVNKPWVTVTSAFDNQLVIPSLTMIAPQPGEEIAIGRELVIAWNRDYVPDPVNVYIDRGSGVQSEELIRAGVTGDSIHWIATGPPAPFVRFIVRTQSGVFVEAYSSGDGFLLAEPLIALTAPTGGEAFVADETMSVTWVREVNDDPVRVELNRAYPAETWELLADNQTGDSYDWIVTGPATENARIRVTSTLDANLTDHSTSNLEIIVPFLSFNAPAAAARLPLGFVAAIAWSRTAVEEPLSLYLSRDGGATYPELLASGLTGSSYDWTPSGAATENAQLKLIADGAPELFTESASFVIPQPMISLTAPTGGEIIPLGSDLTITFSTSDHPAPVDILLNRDYSSGEWEALAEDYAGASFVWTAAGAPSTTARVRVVSTVNEGWFSECAGNFTLIRPALTITAPAADTELIVGDPLTVSWERIAWSGAVDVTLRRVGGETTALGDGILGDELTINIPAPGADQSWIIVADASDPLRGDSIQVAGPFIPELAFVYPTGGERWIEGEQQIIRWADFHAAGAVNIYVDSGSALDEEVLLGTSDSDSIVYTPLGFESDNVSIRIEHAERSAVQAVAENIRVVIPSVTLLSPHSGSYRVGTDLHIAWTTHEVDGDVAVELNRHYPSGGWETLYTGAASSFDWTISGDTTGTARIQVRSLVYPQAVGISEADFAIYEPALSLTLNTESDTLFIGDELGFTLIFSGEEALADIALQREPEGEWETLFTELPSGTVNWTISEAATGNAVFRAFVPGDEAFESVAEGYTIIERALILNSELPPELFVDIELTLGWSPLGVGGPFEVKLLRGEAVEILNESTAETSLNWTVTAPRAETAQIIVSSLTDNSYADTSSVFAIRVPELAFV